MKIDTPNIVSSVSSSERLPWLDFASGVMILWMIIFHALQAAWGYDVRHLWGVTDAALIPEGVRAFINSEGKLEVLNPCVVFPFLHFFMPWCIENMINGSLIHSKIDLFHRTIFQKINQSTFTCFFQFTLFVMFNQNL